jgi:ABC-type antimicrobial peptide transport system permease subunit
MSRDSRPIRVAYLLVRMRTASARLMLEEAIRAADPRAAYSVNLMEESFSRQIARQRQMMRISSGFGALALATAAAGLYALITSIVARRRREIGIRVALGATRHDIRRLIVGSTFRPILTGALLGLIAVVVGIRLVSSLFYGVTAADPITHLVVAALLAAIALVACWHPVRRALRVDPVRTLRED